MSMEISHSGGEEQVLWELRCSRELYPWMESPGAAGGLIDKVCCTASPICLYPAGTKYPSAGFCYGSRQLIPAGSCLRAHFFLLTQTAVYISVCVNNLKYEGFALLFTPLDNINYCREPSSLEKEGENKTTLEKLQALLPASFKGPSASPPKLYRQARAAVAHICSVDITATVLLPSQPRTSTKNVRLVIPQGSVFTGNVAERWFGCMGGHDLWKESLGFGGQMPALLSASYLHFHLTLWLPL